MHCEKYFRVAEFVVKVFLFVHALRLSFRNLLTLHNLFVCAKQLYPATSFALTLAGIKSFLRVNTGLYFLNSISHFNFYFWFYKRGGIIFIAL